MKKILVLILNLFLISCSNKKQDIFYKIKQKSEFVSEETKYTYNYLKNNITGSLNIVFYDKKILEISFTSISEKFNTNGINAIFNFKDNTIIMYGPFGCSADINSFEYKEKTLITSIGWYTTTPCKNINEVNNVINHLKSILNDEFNIDYEELKKQKF